MYKEKEEKAGYAKVEGPNLHHIITNTKVILGRELKHKEDSQISSDEEVVSLGSNLKISRRHLLLYFDYDKCEWYAQNISKNPVFIDKLIFSRTDPPRRISPIAAIQIDDEKFYFFQSKEE